MVVIARAELIPYRLPFTRPLTSARGTRHEREGWLLRLQDEAGRVGWGDAACWPGFGGGLARTRCGLETLVARLPGQELSDEAALEAWLRPLGAPEAAHALELAVLDLWGQTRGVPLAELLSPAPRAAVPCQVLVRDADEARRAVAQGARTLKLKVGAASPSAEEQRLRAVRKAVGADVALRLDANGAWSVSAALSCLTRFARHGIEWIEQPVAARDVAGLAWVRARGSVAVAADEAVRDEASLRALLEAEAVDAVVLKPMFLGGPRRCLELARLARAAGCRVCVTHALDSAVGRAGALHTAAALLLDTACGLSDPFREDVAQLPPLRDGRRRLPPGPGLGLAITPPSPLTCAVAGKRDRA